MIIGFANQKGGVGKSTLAIAFSNFLSDRKDDVLAIDFDSQSTFYGQWNDEVSLMENEPPYEVLEKSLTESSEVVSNLKGITGTYCIVDLPGKMDDDNLLSLYRIMDKVIVPFSYDKAVFESTIIFIQLIKHVNPGVKLYFVPNLIKKSVKFSTKNQIDEILQNFGTITGTIHNLIMFSRISVYGNTKEIQEVVNDVFNEVLNNKE